MLRRFLASLAALALIVSPLAVSASASVIGTSAEVDLLTASEYALTAGSASGTFSTSAVVVTEETSPGDYSAQLTQIVYYIGLVAGILVFFTVVLLCFFSYKFLRIFF